MTAPESDQEHISLCETLDRVLNKGVVLAGEIVISVADVDLIYLGLQMILTSVETAHRQRTAPLGQEWNHDPVHALRQGNRLA